MIKRGAVKWGRATVALAGLALLVLASGCSPNGGTPTSDESSTPDTGYGPVVDIENLVAAGLVADVESFEAGTPFRLGVVFRVVPKTHVYYRYPGSSGLPTNVEWSLPDGFEVGPLQFPNPERFEDVDLGDISYGYEDEVLLFVEVTPPETATGSTVSFDAHAFWLACMEDGLCIPGDAELTLTLAVGAGEASADAEVFAMHAARVAGSPSTAPVTIQSTGESITVRAKDPWQFVMDGATFVPDASDAWGVAEADAINIVFRSLDVLSSPALEVGVMTLPMTNNETGESKMYYVRVEPESGAVDE